MSTEPGSRLSRSGGWFEGDGVAEGFQPADVAALAVFGVDAGGVVAGAQVVEAGGGVGEQVPGNHEDRAADGDDGALERRRAMRRYLSPTKVSVLAAPPAAFPRIATRKAFPWPTQPLPFFFSPGSLMPGARRAQEAHLRGVPVSG